MTRSVIEEDLVIDGNIKSENGDVEVKGRVNGDIASRSVDVHVSGQVQGAITADQVTIQGTHSGRIDCSELSLQKDAEVKADVKAQTLSSEKGARLVGKVQITGG
ncbi:MAG: polymer-forming cytoskeletal protein [Rhodobacteraceae bacterium]|jgi:cytoskeletal protein CcmA (bactofilin family)|nr:polymer-forming cytoskeletal protein [Paracoccaceae bacterium]